LEAYRDLRQADGVSVDSLDTIARFIQSTLTALKADRAAIIRPSTQVIRIPRPPVLPRRTAFACDADLWMHGAPPPPFNTLSQLIAFAIPAAATCAACGRAAALHLPTARYGSDMPILDLAPKLKSCSAAARARSGSARAVGDARKKPPRGGPGAQRGVGIAFEQVPARHAAVRVSMRSLPRFFL
jgi:hypothetical protein